MNGNRITKRLLLNGGRLAYVLLLVVGYFVLTWHPGLEQGLSENWLVMLLLICAAAVPAVYLFPGIEDNEHGFTYDDLFD